MPDGTLLQWLTSAAPPAYAMLLGSAILAVRFWPIWKQRLTEAKTADDAIVGNQWARFESRIEKLEKRCDGLEGELEECREQHAEERAKRMELEALMVGRGQAAQEAQGIVSAERLRGRE